VQEDFDLLAPEHIKKQADALLQAARPPVLGDFFDVDLRRLAALPAERWLLQLTVSLHRYLVPR
jgi:hypothetical protein